MDNKISPLDGLLEIGHHGTPVGIEGADALQISHRNCTSLVQVSAWPKSNKDVIVILEKLTTLKLSGNSTSPANEDFTIMPIGPGKVLIESNIPDAPSQFRNKIPPSKGSVTDLSHGRVVIKISGEQAVWVLAKGIAIDFSLKAFPIDSSRNTAHHDIGLTIRRVDKNTFDLFVFTSFARSFWRWLDIASREVGYEIT